MAVGPASDDDVRLDDVRLDDVRLDGVRDDGVRPLVETVEIAAPVERVFALWTRYERLPRLLEAVRRIKCIGPCRVLWDVDIAGRQLVWEARIDVEIPLEAVRWTSTWGARHAGELGFEALADDRSRLRVEIEYQPGSLLERIGAGLGLVDAAVRRDLERFAQFAERGGAE